MVNLFGTVGVISHATMELWSQVLLASFIAVASIALLRRHVGIHGRKDPKGRRLRPFRNWNHPEKNFVDKLINVVLPFFLPVGSLAKYPSHLNGSDDTRKLIESLRGKLVKLVENPHQITCKEWNALVQTRDKKDALISGTVKIPRNHQVLSLFGFKPSSSTSSDDNSSELLLDLTCPQSTIQSGVELENEPGSEEDANHLKVHGSRRFKTCNLKDIVFHDSAQFLLYFHGGGFVLGTSKDDVGAMMGCNITKHLLERKVQKADTASIVFLSISYRCAPENPFPSAVVDALSASSFLIQNYPSFDLHVAGVSAGGNLAAVAGLETFRKFGEGAISSIMLYCPMMQPRANSSSYYINSQSSLLCPNEFLRWCWSSYLGIENGTNDGSTSTTRNIDFSSENALAEALDKSAWSTLYSHISKKNREEEDEDADTSMLLWRLISPQFDLPSFDMDGAPKVIVLTASADPLHDDGVELVDGLKKKCAMKQSGSIHHFELKGSHALAQHGDPEGFEESFKEWSLAFHK